MRRRRPSTVLLGAMLAACGEEGDPGRADARRGDPPELRIEADGAGETRPRLLVVAPGTEARWLNRTQVALFVRFEQPIAATCVTPCRP